MKKCGGVEVVKLHTFLTSAADGQLHASTALYPGKITPGIYRKGEWEVSEQVQTLR